MLTRPELEVAIVSASHAQDLAQFPWIKRAATAIRVTAPMGGRTPASTRAALPHRGRSRRQGGRLAHHHQRLRRALERRGITGNKQHRNSRTRDALVAGVPEAAIMQVGRMGSVDMLRRYHGGLGTAELALSADGSITSI